MSFSFTFSKVTVHKKVVPDSRARPDNYTSERKNITEHNYIVANMPDISKTPFDYCLNMNFWNFFTDSVIVLASPIWATSHKKVADGLSQCHTKILFRFVFWKVGVIPKGWSLPCAYAGCEITEFPGFRDTQKHCRKPKFLTRVSDWKPCKNQGFSKPKLPIDFPLPFGKPERVSETQILGVGFRKETKFFFVISHPGVRPSIFWCDDSGHLGTLLRDATHMSQCKVAIFKGQGGFWQWISGAENDCFWPFLGSFGCL